MADIMKITAQVREKGVYFFSEKELRKAVDAGRLGANVADDIRSRLERQQVKFGSPLERNQKNHVILYDNRSDGELLRLKAALDSLVDGKANLSEAFTVLKALESLTAPKQSGA